MRAAHFHRLESEGIVGSERGRSVEFPASPDAVFTAILGIVQHSRDSEIRAIHNEARALIIRLGPKRFEWSKLVMIRVFPQSAGSTVSVAVQSLPEGAGGMLDGRRNGKLVDQYFDDIQRSLGGENHTPATAVESHYVRDDGSMVPWVNPDEFPEF